MKNISHGKQKKDSVPNNIKLNSFLLALVLTIPYLNLIFSSFASIQSPGLLFGVLTILIYAISLIRSRKYEVPIMLVLCSMVIFIFFLVSYISASYDGVVKATVLSFLYYGFFSILVSLKSLSIKHTLIYIIILSIIGIIDLNTLINSARTTSGTISMSYSYAFLPSICATIIFLIYYLKESNLIILIGCAFNIYLLWLVVTDGSRGALLAIAFLIVLLITNRYKKGHHKVNKWIIYILLIGILYLIVDFNNFIRSLYHFTHNYGFSLNIIDKTYSKSLEGDALNNREYIYGLAVEGIKQSPIIGHGIGSFEIKYGGYPHNLLLQLLYEGGIILTTVVLGPILYGFIWLYKKKTNNFNISMLIILLSSIGIPRLLFSANVWSRESFWLLFGLVIAHVIAKRRN
ncbi:O-antigen ligase family protein [Salinicoccus siamensis]|uniref:O-antigen ligase family protein n=1 Tax=Salinicoccus siamensis TaxID=381830 RepID=A0ABV5Z4H2_9STAP